MAHWRAIQVQPTREPDVEDVLAGHNIPVFCPRIRIRLHRPGSPLALRPLFPSYIFADIDGQPFAILKRCHYVIAVLGSTPIPMTIIECLQNPPANVCVSPQWVVGHTYRLKSPQALAGILVRLEALDAHAKASVMLTLFGAERVVSVSVSDLQEQ